MTQRLYGLALGYEDLNDQDRLRLDPLLAVACDTRDPLGLDRLHQKGIALAGPSTLNRLELSNNKATRYHKVSHDPKKVQNCVLQLGGYGVCPNTPANWCSIWMRWATCCTACRKAGTSVPTTATTVICHSLRVGATLRCGRNCAPAIRTLRRGGVTGALEQIVAVLRRRCRRARIMVRADSGFCREELLAWCERQGVY